VRGAAVDDLLIRAEDVNYSLDEKKKKKKSKKSEKKEKKKQYMWHEKIW